MIIQCCICGKKIDTSKPKTPYQSYYVKGINLYNCVKECSKKAFGIRCSIGKKLKKIEKYLAEIDEYTNLLKRNELI